MSFTKWRCLVVSMTFTVALAVGAGALLLAGDDDAGAEVRWLLPDSCHLVDRVRSGGL
jgi:hypothetical protein